MIDISLGNLYFVLSLLTPLYGSKWIKRAFFFLKKSIKNRWMIRIISFLWAVQGFTLELK